MTHPPLTAEQLLALAECVDQASYWRGSLLPEERDALDDCVATARVALERLRALRIEEPAA